MSGLEGLLVGGVIGLAIMWTVGPLMHRENPVRFWVWMAGHLFRKPAWIEWGITNVRF